MKFIPYSVVLFLLLLAACSPEQLPPEESTEPVFVSSFEVNGEARLLSAGLEDYYMYSDFTKVEDIYTFSGELKEANCTNSCGERIRFSIQDFGAVTNEPAWNEAIDSILAMGNYDYIGETMAGASFMTLNLFANPTGTAPFAYQWTTSMNDLDIFTDEFLTIDISNQALPIDVTLNVTDANDCVSSHSKTIDIDQSNCEAMIFVSTIGQNTSDSILLSVEASPNAIVTWSTGETTNEIEVLQAGEYCVTVNGIDGCTASSCINILFIDPSTIAEPYCTTSFDAEIGEGVDSTTFINGRIKITYVDNNGTLFQSDLVAQDESNYFEILSSIDYDLNEQGQKTRQLEILFDCTLLSENGNSINIKNGTATIAVAYP